MGAISPVQIGFGVLGPLQMTADGAPGDAGIFVVSAVGNYWREYSVVFE